MDFRSPEIKIQSSFDDRPETYPMKTFSTWNLAIWIWIGISLFPLRGWAATLAEIEQRGHLIVGVKENLPPLGYRDTARNLQGFEIDLAKRLAQALFQSKQAKSEQILILKPLSNPDRLTAVASGAVDMAIADITLTDNRMRLVSFSEPYYRSGTGLLSKDPQWNTLQSLYRQSVAVLAPSVTLAYLRPRLPKANLVGVASYAEARKHLDIAQVQAIAGDQIVLSNIAQQNPQYTFSPTKLTVQPLAIALPKGVQYDPLRQWINRNLQNWRRQGWLETQRQRWAMP
jgi:polar amino acid transport system substrate-binding protein